MKRICLECGFEKPLEKFGVFKLRSGERSHRYRCRTCENERRSNREEESGKRVRMIHGSRFRDLRTKLKLCAQCKEWLPFAEFSPRSGERNHDLRSWCRRCQAKKTNEWRAENRSLYLQRKRQRQLDGKDKNRIPIWAINRMARKLGMQPEELHRIIREHSGKCEICGQTPELNGRFKRLNIDHNHSTGKFRGLLCGHCNLGLGKFGDSESRLLKAAVYLKKRGGFA